MTISEYAIFIVSEVKKLTIFRVITNKFKHTFIIFVREHQKSNGQLLVYR